MKFKVETGAFARTLGRVQGPLKGKKISPVAACLALEAMPGKLKITATDAEMTAVATVAADVQEKGIALVNGKNLFDCAKAFPAVGPDAGGKDAPTLVSVKVISNQAKSGGNVDIECRKTRYRLPFYGVDSLGTKEVIAPDISGITMKQVGQAILLSMVTKTSHAMSTDTTRYNLTGMYFEPAGGGLLRTVATDGHRVFFTDRPAAFPEDFKPMLVSDRGVEELQRVLALDKKTEIGWDERRLIVAIDDLLMILPLLNASFPEYKMVVPENSTIIVTLKKDDVVAALHRLALIHKGTNNPQATFAFEKGMVVLSSTSVDLGEAREEIECDYQGSAFRMAFNATYVAESLAAMECEDFTIGMTDQHSPGVFKPVKADVLQQAVIMPMRI